MKLWQERLVFEMVESLLFLQARMKIGELQDQENHMTEVLMSYDSAISSGDASSLSEASLREVTPVFNDSSFLTIGPTPTTSPKVSHSVGVDVSISVLCLVVIM